MTNPTSLKSKSRTSFISSYWRLALPVALCAILLGVGAISLQKAAAQNPSRIAAEQAKPGPQQVVTTQASQSVNVNWLNDGRKPLAFDDYLRSLNGSEGMSAKVVPTRGSGNGNPTSILVIYDQGGHVRLCIGSAAACKALMN